MMIRRLHVPRLHEGRVVLPAEEAHHALDVLRLRQGTVVELFDDAGQVARGRIMSVSPDVTAVDVETIAAEEPGRQLTIAAAVPKGNRADWMIEKLGELGCGVFIPLRTRRSIVHPEAGRIERWNRIAIESAKQSRRPRPLKIEPLTKLEEALVERRGWLLSLDPRSRPVVDHLRLPPPDSLLLFIGPEGGWAEDEELLLQQSGLMPVSLGRTVLRTETAAVAAAAIVAAWFNSSV